MKALRLSFGCYLMLIKESTFISWSLAVMNYLRNVDCSSFQLWMDLGVNLFHQSSADLVKVSEK